jgi:FADH2 O2-dependent halogenase
MRIGGRGAFDLAVIGSGFGGSLLAMIARRLGRSVALIERGRHPRFVIGESSTPLADLLWAELTRRYDLPRLLPLTKWGSWQRAYPQLGCGLKRGFSFFHHGFHRPFTDGAKHRHQLLVAASSNNETADTHWYRPDFDQFLVQETQALGVEYLDQTELEGVSFAGATASLWGARAGRSVRLRARFLVDASGPRGFLHRRLGLPELPFELLPPTQALYSHFTDVRKLAELGIPASGQSPPYPPDDAALHHLFAGGWIWVLRFNNGLTSAGVAATDALAKRLGLAEGAPAWQRLLDCLPTVREQFRPARAARSFVHTPRLPFRSGVVAGPNWALLPYAVGFIDPLLSTGFPLTLLGLARLAAALEMGPAPASFAAPLAAYARQTQAELLAAEALVAALYANLDDFPVFAQVAKLYFGAASFAETARRLGRPELAGGFLLHDHPRFGPALRDCCALARPAPGEPRLGAAQQRRLRTAIRRALAPVDVIGLSRSDRRNWYPMEPQEFLRAAEKLGLTQSEWAPLTQGLGASF